MKHLKPILVLIAVISGLIALCYWPVHSLTLIFIFGILITAAWFYKIIYDYFNDK